ncbi:SAC3/GANP/Nin1/mts3/eIF-3 p25 family-domain-containing protein [Cantharellus anzutake]|uniref:SAC3/GANP/Nin1/mts3/eIF-3 p25 family-domain-containing protein n=1 Tax=Cantharellus anzutake TaxID=1750568 RepID=UPI001904F207|nr:SAC3/GANP/Nin1/mts3/eIF-3 p25 family-domain-containing protein [Cantharellus anzutake]KAF8336517.1 SAC3/GANP/Nin1/mts3/eIF-3 p25 family-domain-containing protein [Cantharellus anzutake]
MSSVNGAATARLARFSGVESENRYENVCQSQLLQSLWRTLTRYLQLKKDREAARAKAIRDGLIPDPNRKTRLEEAFNLVGTCEDMCPEFEREQREYQRAVDKWELNPVTRRIDPKRAVKTFHRPAAGDETPLPSDVRPPHVLKMTLDYLIHDLLESNSLEATHHFLRDRTRSIRQDFTLQHENGLIAIECHERIARLHILSLHEMRGVQDFTEHMEMEQLRKVLQSIVEFYDDSRYSNTLPPNEPEFRAYHLLAHIRDPDVARQLERQPAHILDSPIVQVALDLRSLAQRNNITSSRRAANTEATQNFFSRLFATIRQPQVSFMMACLMEYHFADIRKGALKAMKSSFREAHKAFPIGTLTEMLGFDDETQTASFASACRLELVLDPASAMPVGVKLHSKALFDGKLSARALGCI